MLGVRVANLLNGLNAGRTIRSRTSVLGASPLECNHNTQVIHSAGQPSDGTHLGGAVTDNQAVS